DGFGRQAGSGRADRRTRAGGNVSFGGRGGRRGGREGSNFGRDGDYAGAVLLGTANEGQSELLICKSVSLPLKHVYDAMTKARHVLLSGFVRRVGRVSPGSPVLAHLRQEAS